MTRQEKTTQSQHAKGKQEIHHSLFPLCQLVDDVLNMGPHRSLVLGLLSTKPFGQKRQQIGIRDHRCIGCLDRKLLRWKRCRSIGSRGYRRASSIVQKTGQICRCSGLRCVGRWKRLLRNSGHRGPWLKRREERLKRGSIQRRDHIRNIGRIRQCRQRLLWHWRRWKRRHPEWCRGRERRRRTTAMRRLCVEDNLRGQVGLKLRVF